MDMKAVDQKKRKKQKSSGQIRKGKKGDPNKVRKHKSKDTQKKHRRSKSRSKTKKKSGFLCCRKKKKKSGKTQSKPTKKQPKGRTRKPLAPVPNEQLGEVVLVGSNIKTPETPQKKEKEPETPRKDGLKQPKSNSVENAQLSNEKIGSEKDEERAENGKVALPKGSEKEKNEKLKPAEQENERNTERKEKKRGFVELGKLLDDLDKTDSKLITLKPLAEKVVSRNSIVATTDFSLVSSYIPPHITKKNFSANISKNRFADVICMDHSRVRLADSSYIHANWVQLDHQKQAILTQFPLQQTADNFWQMLIEQKTKCILLIMTDQEYKSFGGDFVFPQNQDFLSFEKGSIRVGEFKQMELGKGWNLKVISITNGNYKTFIHVHHYKNWLHDSVPSDIKQVWQLHSYLQKYTGPPVYMSLSGCGRAGTYALLESAKASLDHEPPSFNMIKSLESVRNGRLHSVQNLSQFSFVYTMIAEHIMANGQHNESGKDQENSTAAILRQLTIE